MTLYSLKLCLPQSIDTDHVTKISQCFNDDSVSVSYMQKQVLDKNIWEIIWMFQSPPSKERLSIKFELLKTLLNQNLEEWLLTDVPQKNWLEECYKKLPPITVGPFFIFGSHYKGRIPKKSINLNIDAATAFGTGDHPTTQGCLLFLNQLYSQGFLPSKILDMGTGSGILAIAACKLFHTQIIAVDNDEESIKLSKRHVAKNNILIDKIKIIHSNGFANRNILKHAPYNLIIANILAGPLIDLAKELSACLSDNGGTILLSGLLTEQQEQVVSTYKIYGMKLEQKQTIRNWDTLLLTKLKS